MVKQMRKFAPVCLICGLGLVLMFVAFAPYHFTREAVVVQQAEHHSGKRSSVRFNEGEIRLKPVYAGEISHGFVLIENVGSKVVQEVTVLPDCSCSELKLSNTTINPGETIRADFSIDTKGREEDFVTHFIFKYSENDQNLFDTFYVTVPVLTSGRLFAKPSSLIFYRANVDEHFSRDIELKVKDLPENESVDIVDISSPDWISVSLAKQGVSWELTLSGAFPVQSERYVEFVQIKSTSERYPEIVIPIIVEYATDADTHR